MIKKTNPLSSQFPSNHFYILLYNTQTHGDNHVTFCKTCYIPDYNLLHSIQIHKLQNQFSSCSWGHFSEIVRYKVWRLFFLLVPCSHKLSFSVQSLLVIIRSKKKTKTKKITPPKKTPQKTREKKNKKRTKKENKTNKEKKKIPKTLVWDCILF